ncbi:DUF5677 domain-containing protein [Roseicyclus mahoneyensis]|uniref:Uncharacterized protein n=1 Tax=Roseicyclus mahoneyensis TaxID=164332 RepID=A0A316GGX4_9RHOB|nr:DUF5677 domain-containing protein [Roseicyclus mahoneyensis]PWK60272.1 hypothetical protein C7455_105257 [Roseicyclus mahoneyensis]
MGFIEKDVFETIERELERALQEHPELTSDELEAATERALQSSLDALFEVIPGVIESSAAKALKTSRKLQLGFEQRCYRRWRKAFELFEIIRGVAAEIGEKHAQEHFRAVEEERDYIFFALSHLHPRMLLVASEIDALLRTGFPDGALARWRTLHEIAVVALFIAQSDQDTAKRYLASFQFNAHRDANQLNEYAQRANLSPFSAEEIEAMGIVCQAFEKEVGRAIGREYDWAKEALKKDRPTLFDLEKATGQDHWRPRYRWACQHVHAGHRPSDKLLGMSEAKNPVNLIGSSNSGFVDPFSMSACSISDCCRAFFERRATIDSVVALKSIQVLSERLGHIALQLETDTLESYQKRTTFKGIATRSLNWLRKLVS